MWFDRKLLAFRHEPWARYYLDYNHLKSMLDESCVHCDGISSSSDVENLRLGSVSSLPYYGAIQNEETFEFFLLLNVEVDKILLFFLSEQGRVASEIECVRKEICFDRQDPLWWSKPGNRETMSKQISDTAVHLLRLLQYVDINLEGIRRLLEKHDRVSKVQLRSHYLEKQSYFLQPLLSNESVDGLIRLFHQTLDMWKQLSREQSAFISHKQRHDKFPCSKSQDCLTFPTATSSQRRAVSSSSLITFDLLQKSYGSLNGLSNMEDKIESYPVEIILHHIKQARKSLHRSNNFVRVLAAPMIVQEADEEGASFTVDGEVAPSTFSNFLNLVSTFLYMTNYYIVAPSSGIYAEKLGSDPSMAGIIIGMTPVAALVSTLLYSWWTSYSYKSALIFASTCSAVGNILYALGLPFQSLTLVMLGRFVNGFGSARSINRRYIVDSFEKDERTAASAAFVTAGALGMATGPALASVLNYAVNNQLENPYWQIESAPGWFMFICWSVYLLCLIFFFTDPPRRCRISPLVSASGEEQAHLKSEPSEMAKAAAHDKLISISVIVGVYFVLKLALECILSSSSLVATSYFHWTGRTTGFFMAGLGLLMLPANLVVAVLSRRYEDRELIRSLLVAMMSGCLMAIKFTDDYSVVQYLAGVVMVFVSANALEGPSMSQLSKVIPQSWSKGFLNVGLLATEAGTLGRAVGDVLVSLCGTGGKEGFLNYIFFTLSAMSTVSTLLMLGFYDKLDSGNKYD